MMLFVFKLGSGLMCHNTITPDIMNCSFATPSLNCTTYTYEVYNESNGDRVQNGTLTQLNGSIYFFNWTINSTGSYIIKLCDDTTREVYQENGDEKMLIGVIVLLPIFFIIIFLIVSQFLGEEHLALKILFYGLTFPCLFASGWFALISLNFFYNITSLSTALGSFIWWMSLILFFIFGYFLVYVIYKFIEGVKKFKINQKGY